MYVSEMKITEARDDFAEVVNRVAFGNERVQLTRHGKPVVALVSASDLKLLEALEDEEDLRALLAAEGDPENAGGPIPLEQVKRNLGI